MQAWARIFGGTMVAGLMLGGCTSSAPFADFDQLSGQKFAQVDTPEPFDGAPPAEIMDPDNVSTPGIVSAYVDPGPVNTSAQDEIDFLISKYASAYHVPEGLVHRVVSRESTYKPRARNGIHLGLMQMNPTTARTMGYRGDNLGLLDAETNLKYGVKYLAGAYMVAEGDEDRADKFYQTGYYYHAKRMGLLRATGLRP